MARLWSKTTRNRCALALLSVAACFAGFAAPAVAQSDNENSTPANGWYWYYGISAATVTDTTDNGYRLTDISIDSVSPLRFNTVFVHNSGEYAKTWWWYYGLTEQQVSDFLSTNNARLTDIAPYDDGNGNTRFACIMIRNTGEDASGWWWYYGQTGAQLLTHVNDNNARLIDLDSYQIGGVTRYSGVMIPNSGANARTWWWYYNITGAQVNTFVSDNQARITEISPNNTGSGTYNVVMQRDPAGTTPHWWWYYNVDAAFVSNAINQNGARLIDMDRWTTPAGSRFTVAMINNSNALTTRIGDILRNGTDGVSGCYLKQVNGPVLASLNQDYTFEPASMIKILHHTHAMLQVQNGAINLTTSVNVFSGYSGSCPQDTGGFTEQLRTSLNLMMENSDNARTQAMRVRFGEANINATAANLGLTHTGIHHRLGCAGGDDGAIIDPNMFSLRDAGSLYEQIATNLFTNTNRNTLYNLMADTEEDGMFSGIANIITQEGGTLGFTAAQREAFTDLVFAVSKGGNYGLCSPGCIYDQTRGGSVRLPFRAGCDMTPREFVYATFVNNATNDANAGAAASNAYNELLREQIHAAMQSWQTCTVDWNFDGFVNSQDFFDFLSAFFTGNADYNHDRFTNSQDFFDFLTAFFSH